MDRTKKIIILHEVTQTQKEKLEKKNYVTVIGPKKLSNNEGLMRDARISLGGGNKVDFADGLELGEIGNRRDQETVEEL